MPPRLGSGQGVDFTSLTFQDVTRNFGRRRALNRVSFTCQAGQVVALLGANGAGKSTLLSIAATLLERANPGAIEARKQDAGRLYNVAEFAAEVASAAADPIPADHTRYVGDTSGFVRE